MADVTFKKNQKSGGKLTSWLLSDSPQSVFQARCQRAFIAWIAFRANPIAMAGLFIILSLLFVAFFAPLITQSDGTARDLANRLSPPSSDHWFGTDELGRDIFERIIWGSRITLYIVGLVAIIVVPIGLAIGTIAGFVSPIYSWHSHV